MEELLFKIDKMLENKNISYNIEGILIALKEEIEIELFSKRNNVENYEKALEMSKIIKKVQLGCGKHLLSNYINVDITKNADVIWDIRKSLPFQDESIDNFFSEHVFEHMDYPIAANNLLKEIYRCLKKDGELIIGVPDSDYPINDIINNTSKNMNIAKEKWYKNRIDVIDNMNTNIDYLNYVMRDQLFHNKYHPHYWGYNKENLTLLLKKHGFINIKIWNPDISIINPKRKWGTLYLIANK